MMQALADRLAEALAEYVHREIRVKLEAREGLAVARAVLRGTS